MPAYRLIKDGFMRKKIMQVDFNPWYFICNMQCQYCIPHFKYKVENNRIYIKKGQAEYQFYARMDHLFLRAQKVLTTLSKKCDVGILTFSGTEAFLFEHIFELIDHIKEYFPKIQIITNGLELSEEYIKRLEKLNTRNNISITLSLDGYDKETNYSRTGNDVDKLEKILHALQSLSKSKLPFDIYTVITKYNVKELGRFFHYLQQVKADCAVQTWPVFGENKLSVGEKDAGYLEELLSQYEEFTLRLQPKIYYEYMIQYLKEGRRKFPCYLPYCSFYLRDNGDIKACLCNGIIDVGNMNELDVMSKDFYENSFYQDILDIEKQKMPCTKCFINWDLMNLYFEGLVNEEEIRKIPLFNDQHLWEILHYYKQEMKVRKAEVH